MFMYFILTINNNNNNNNNYILCTLCVLFFNYIFLSCHFVFLSFGCSFSFYLCKTH